MPKEDLLNVVRRLLRDVVRTRFEGGAYAKLSRAHGYADGYMAALIDTGAMDRRALLDMVSEERARPTHATITAH